MDRHGSPGEVGRGGEKWVSLDQHPVIFEDSGSPSRVVVVKVRPPSQGHGRADRVPAERCGERRGEEVRIYR